MIRLHLPKFLNPDVMIPALRGHERIAGLLIEETRVRAAELAPPSGKRTTPSVISEGAVRLPDGTIREGKVADRKKLLAALRELLREAAPRPLTAHLVILSVPALPIFTKTIRLPAAIRQKEIFETLHLEAESLLPIPVSETYLDWQRVPHKAVEYEGEEYVIIAARRQDLDPYFEVVRAAGLSPIAVEPFTLSVARGLKPDPARPAFVAYLLSDAVLAAALEADAVRFPHHVSVPAAPAEVRAEAIAAEISNFTRFLKAEEHQTHLAGGAGLRLLVDGMVDDATLGTLQEASQELSMPIDFSSVEHELSKAAARGAALRGIIPRQEDRLISLMLPGTEEAYARSRAQFFLSAAASVFAFGAAAVIVISSIALGAVWFQENVISKAVKTQSIPSETQELVASARRFNEVVEHITFARLSQKNLFDPISRVLLLKTEGLEVRNVQLDNKGTMTIAVFANTQETLRQFLNILNAANISLEKQVLPFGILQKPVDIFYEFRFTVIVP